MKTYSLFRSFTISMATFETEHDRAGPHKFFSSKNQRNVGGTEG